MGFAENTLSFEKMADKYEPTLKAARLLRYVLMQDGADDDTLANMGKNWRLMSRIDYDDYMTLERQGVCQCFTRSACRTYRLYRCPWRPSSLLHALCASYVLSLLLSLAPLITAARALRVIRVGSCSTDRAAAVLPVAPAVRLLRPAV